MGKITKIEDLEKELKLLESEVPPIVELLSKKGVKAPFVLKVRAESAEDQTETYDDLNKAIMQFLFCKYMNVEPYLLDASNHIVFDSAWERKKRLR